MDWVAIGAIPLAGLAVLTLVLWGMRPTERAFDEKETDQDVVSAVPGVATGHHRSTETGGAA